MKLLPFLLMILVLSLSLQSCFTVQSTAKFSYKKLDPETYAAYLKDSADHYLIDVRTPGENKKAHIAGARNYDFLAFHLGADVDTLDRNKVAFLYCQTCHRSPFAARIMKHKGFRALYDLRGGFAKWVKANQKTETLVDKNNKP
jgi:rhodanese-related sulfurtransferase